MYIYHKIFILMNTTLFMMLYDQGGSKNENMQIRY
jgi:hypothetical protein